MVGYPMYQGDYPVPSTIHGEHGTYVLTEAIYPERGTAFKAITGQEDTAATKRVFVKAYIDPLFWRDYKRERKAIQALMGDAPNMLLPFDCARIDKPDENLRMRFFVYPWLDAVTLNDYIDQRGPLSIDETADLLRQLGTALTYAHARGVYDRDIKPDNVMVLENPRRYVRVDFGLTTTTFNNGEHRLLDRRPGYVAGTTQYVPLEALTQLTRHATERAEVYQLGLLAYECLTGERPFPTINALPENLQLFALYDELNMRSEGLRLASAVEKAIERATKPWPGGRTSTVQGFIEEFCAEASGRTRSWRNPFTSRR